MKRTKIEKGITDQSDQIWQNFATLEFFLKKRVWHFFTTMRHCIGNQQPQRIFLPSGRHSSVFRLCLPSAARFESQVYHLCFFQFVLKL